jgi:hypothetical protein
MKTLRWGALALAVACGGKTIGDPEPLEPEPRPVVPDDPDPPPVARGGSGYGGSINTGGTVVVGTGGGISTGGSIAGGTGPVMGGAAGAIGVGGSAGGFIPQEQLGNLQYGTCQGVALLPQEGWTKGPWDPGEMTKIARDSWIGLASSPWGHWDVEFTFGGDDYYSAHALSGVNPALYYGTDLDHPLKQWRLLEASSWGAAGEIDVVYWDPPAEAYESGHQGYIDCMHADQMQSRLRFEFWYGEPDDEVWGPIVYDLTRQ